MCDGEKRLKAGGGHGSLTRGKGEPTSETEPIFLAGKNWRVFAITNLIIRTAFNHGLNGLIILFLPSQASQYFVV
jgi:hypothetical protein